MVSKLSRLYYVSLTRRLVLTLIERCMFICNLFLTLCVKRSIAFGSASTVQVDRHGGRVC